MQGATVNVLLNVPMAVPITTATYNMESTPRSTTDKYDMKEDTIVSPSTVVPAIKTPMAIPFHIPFVTVGCICWICTYSRHR